MYESGRYGYGLGLLCEVLLVKGSARSRLNDIVMARRRPNILDYCPSEANSP